MLEFCEIVGKNYLNQFGNQKIYENCFCHHLAVILPSFSLLPKTPKIKKDKALGVMI